MRRVPWIAVGKLRGQAVQIQALLALWAVICMVVAGEVLDVKRVSTGADFIQSLQPTGNTVILLMEDIVLPEETPDGLPILIQTEGQASIAIQGGCRNEFTLEERACVIHMSKKRMIFYKKNSLCKLLLDGVRLVNGRDGALSIINCDVWINNISVEGSMYQSDTYDSSFGGGITFNRARALLTGSHFARNNADYGGALALRDSTAVIKDCTFRQNEASLRGTSIDVSLGSTAVLQRSQLDGPVSDSIFVEQQPRDGFSRSHMFTDAASQTSASQPRIGQLKPRWERRADFLMDDAWIVSASEALKMDAEARLDELCAARVAITSVLCGARSIQCSGNMGCEAGQMCVSGECAPMDIEADGEGELSMDESGEVQPELKETEGPAMTVGIIFMALALVSIALCVYCATLSTRTSRGMMAKVCGIVEIPMSHSSEAIIQIQPDGLTPDPSSAMVSVNMAPSIKSSMSGVSDLEWQSKDSSANANDTGGGAHMISSARLTPDPIVTPDATPEVTPEATPRASDVTPAVTPTTIDETPAVTPTTIDETPVVTPRHTPRTMPVTPRITSTGDPRALRSSPIPRWGYARSELDTWTGTDEAFQFTRLVASSNLGGSVPATCKSACEQLASDLDHMHMTDTVLIQRFVLLPRKERRQGGQGIVQFAIGKLDSANYAIKFFLDRESFLQERALYADPVLQEMMPAVSDVFSNDDQLLLGNSGVPLPPFIVIERGESLNEWAAKGAPDFWTSLTVLQHIGERLRQLHRLGKVHCDLKPGNILWRPRSNQWTLIDFGCTSSVGSTVSICYSALYAAPEIMQAVEDSEQTMVIHGSIDMWSFGVVAFELLTSSPAFEQKTPAQVTDALLGHAPLPWEQLTHQHHSQLKVLGPSVLAMLQRDPAKRPTIEQLLDAWENLFASDISQKIEAIDFSNHNSFIS